MTSIIDRGYVYIVRSKIFDENIAKWSNNLTNPPVYKIGKCQVAVSERIIELRGGVSVRMKLNGWTPEKYANQMDWEEIKSREICLITPIKLISLERLIQNNEHYSSIQHAYKKFMHKIPDHKARKELFCTKNALGTDDIPLYGSYEFSSYEYESDMEDLTLLEEMHLNELLEIAAHPCWPFDEAAT